MNAVNAPLTVNGGDGLGDTLNVDDTGDSLANTGTLTSTTLTGLGMASGIVYGTLESVNVNLGSGGDPFTIASTHTGATALNTHAGADTVNVRTIGGATAVNAGADVDTVNVGSLEPAAGGTVNAINVLLNDTATTGIYTLSLHDALPIFANTGTLTSTTLTGLGMASGIVYGTLESVNVNLGSGGDTFAVASTRTAAHTDNTCPRVDAINVQTIDAATTMNAGADVDTVNVRRLEPALR